MKLQSDAVVIAFRAWPFPPIKRPFDISSLILLYLLAIGLIVSIPNCAIDVVKERAIGIYSQLKVMGISPLVYWTSTFLVDCCLLYIVSILTIILLVAFSVPAFTTTGAILVLIILFIIYIPVFIFTSYNLSHLFSNYETCQKFFALLLLLLFLAPFLLVFLIESLDAGKTSTALHYVLAFIDPLYGFYGGLIYKTRLFSIHQQLQLLADPEIDTGKYFEWSSHILIVILTGVMHLAVQVLTLYMIERHKLGEQVKLSKSPLVTPKVEVAVTSPAEDVEEEKKKVDQYFSFLPDVVANPANVEGGAHNDGVSIALRSVNKTYSSQYGGGSKKKSCEAVKDVSLLVESGQIFGLLGPNGAGKSTTVSIVVGEFQPTSGSIKIKGGEQNQVTKRSQNIGYTPQHNTLWDDLTVSDHLELYSSIKGVGPIDRLRLLDCLKRNLGLKEHENKSAKTLSGGTKRKLMFAISILGASDVVVLDEPSTGLDPMSKRFLWTVIKAVFTGGGGTGAGAQSKAALLTTHNLEEADILCSRIAIITNGSMRCIGTPQHLKARYGENYSLEIKLSNDDLNIRDSLDDVINQLTTFIMSHYPSAEIKELFPPRVLYSIRKEDVSLAQVFSLMEENKSKFRIEEYSFSQATLEQVFLQMARSQSDNEAATAASLDPVSTNNVRISTNVDGGAAAYHASVPPPPLNNPADAEGATSTKEA